MSATQATVLANQVTGYSIGLAETAEVTRLLDEVLRDFARRPDPWSTSFISINAGVGVIAALGGLINIDTFIPPAVGVSYVRVLAAFYGGKQLTQASLLELEAKATNWRTHTGTPVAYVFEGEADRIVRFYPVPSGAVEDVVGFIVSDVRASQLPDCLNLPLGLLVLAREFERESNHRDPEFASECRKLGEQLLVQMA